MKTAPVLSTMPSRQRTILLTAALLGFTGLLFGIFGSHQFRARLDPEDFRDYEKGVQYQYFYTLLLFAIGILYGYLRENKALYATFIVFTIGTVLFCGSLYLIATAPISGLAVPYAMYLVTPLGGFFFLAGWLVLIIALLRVRAGTLVDV